MAVSIINESGGDAKSITKLIAKKTLAKDIKAASVRTLCQKINMFRLHETMAKQASPQIDLVSIADITKIINNAKKSAESRKSAVGVEFDINELVKNGKRSPFFRDNKTGGFINKTQLKSAAELKYSYILDEFDNKNLKHMYNISKVRNSEEEVKKAVDQYIDYSGKVPEAIRIIKEATDNKAIRSRLFKIAKAACTAVDIRKYANNAPDTSGYINWVDPFPSKILDYIKNLKAAAGTKQSLEKIASDLDIAREKMEKIFEL